MTPQRAFAYLLQKSLSRMSRPLKPRSALPLPLALALLAPSPPQTTGAAEVRLNGHAFTLPEGFTIELVADNHLAPRPIAGSFDPQGRLYVTDSSGSNKPPAEQLKDPQSRILRLTDADGDGRFETSSVFADRVMFPQGCLWHNGSVYVAGPPSIWKFTDTDGDGIADERVEWYQGQVLTGCANDVHGPYLGPEGMLYWTKGAFARLDLKEARGRAITDRCAHVFRAWPDGSGLESVMSGGMDNPVEVAFTTTGEPIVISTFLDLSQPGRRDGLAHAVYGGVFGKVNDVVNEPMVRRTGDLLPALTQYGPAAACALMRYEGDSFGPAYRGNLFGTLFNLRKVTRHVIQPEGATFRTEDSDFLVSDLIDFRPTDVLEDVDGSLLVVDTGGWYKLCCPSSQLAKVDVLGAIYRVRKAGTPTLAGLARTVAYGRFAARPPQLDEASPIVPLKRAALAAQPDSAARFRETLERQVGAATTSPEAAHLVRVAAEGLGRLGDRNSIPTLFAAIGATGTQDRFLEHSLTFALIEIGAADETRPFLTAADPAIRRAALLVLEQIGPGGPALAATDVVPLLTASEAPLRETARWVARRHPQWGGALAGHFRARLTAPGTSQTEKTGWEELLSLLAQTTEGQPFLAEVVTVAGYRPESIIAALRAMGDAGVKAFPEGWRSALLAAVGLARPADIRSAALRAGRGLPFPKDGDPAWTAALHALARDNAQPTALRLDALGGLPAGAAVDAPELAAVLSALEPARPPGERLAAANAVGRLKLVPAQLHALTGTLPTAGPLELSRILAAFSPGGDQALGTRLLAALEQSKALRALRAEDLKPQLAKFPAPVQAAADLLLAAQQTDTAQDRARLDALLVEVQKFTGQVRSGQTLFNSAKAACSSCHRLGYLGGDLGPDLTAIGQVRTDRDLLEALVYPSASLVRSYEPWIASTSDGEEYSGVMRRDTPDEIVLATGPGAEVRLRRSDITELRLGALSTMPAGLDEQFSRQELADLLAFLKNTRWGVN